MHHAYELHKLGRDLEEPDREILGPLRLYVNPTGSYCNVPTFREPSEAVVNDACDPIWFRLRGSRVAGRTGNRSRENGARGQGRLRVTVYAPRAR